MCVTSFSTFLKQVEAPADGHWYRDLIGKHFLGREINATKPAYWELRV